MTAMANALVGLVAAEHLWFLVSVSPRILVVQAVPAALALLLVLLVR